MCTVTILRDAKRVQITMNRDEARTRAAEHPPRLARGADDGPAWIGPADGTKGGTWIAANEHGVVACLLNAYVPQDLALLDRDDVPSRGLIIPELMERDPAAVRRWLTDRFDPSPYPSFSLVVAFQSFAVLYTWRLDQGIEHSTLPEGWSMVSSSFWRADEVVPWREREFAQWCDQGYPADNGLPGFNLLEAPGRREWSPFMTRPLSLTRSITQVDVPEANASIRMRYWRREGETRIDPARPTAVHELPPVATEVLS
jgi:hypothetical protein